MLWPHFSFAARETATSDMHVRHSTFGVGSVGGFDGFRVWSEVLFRLGGSETLDNPNIEARTLEGRSLFFRIDVARAGLLNIPLVGLSEDGYGSDFRRLASVRVMEGFGEFFAGISRMEVLLKTFG